MGMRHHYYSQYEGPAPAITLTANQFLRKQTKLSFQKELVYPSDYTSLPHFRFYLALSTYLQYFFW